MTPFEAAIQKFEQKCRDFYCEEHQEASSLTNEERKKRRTEALKHLDQERRFAEVAVDVQSQLEEYRKAGRANTGTKGTSVLSAEAHHPTKVLAKFMRAAGKPQPSAQHAAHHIVAGKGKTVRAAQARLKILKASSIRWVRNFGLNTGHERNGLTAV